MNIVRRIALSLAMMLAASCYAQSFVGVWRTIDASDEVGKQQKGVVFRSDGTGEFISPTATTDTSEEWKKLLETATAGSTNMKFKYTFSDGVAAITITHFGGLAVSKSNTIYWRVHNLAGRQMKLTAEDGSGKWVQFVRI